MRGSRRESILTFTKAIVDATGDLVCAFKPQIAYFAADRAEDQLEELCAHIRGHAAARAADPRRQARRHRPHRRAVRDRGVRALRRRCGDGEPVPRHRLDRAVPRAPRQRHLRPVPHVEPGRRRTSRSCDVGGTRCTSGWPGSWPSGGTIIGSAGSWSAGRVRPSSPGSAPSSATTSRSSSLASVPRAATPPKPSAAGATAAGDGLVVSSSRAILLRLLRGGFRRCGEGRGRGRRWPGWPAAR